MMTNQEIFTKVVTHLRQQGKNNVMRALVASGVPNEALRLVNELQEVHDLNEVESWQSKLQDIAANYSLEMPQ